MPRVHAPASPFVTLIASTLREADAEALLLGRANQGPARTGGDGSLFINEIEDLPQIAQRVLMGVLESGTFTR